MTIVDKTVKPSTAEAPIDSGSRRTRRSPVLVSDGLRPRHPRPHPQLPVVEPLSQTPGLQKNADGSVDIFFGPKAPAGKEFNWIPTTPTERSRSSSASTARRNRCSTRRGSCRTSSGSCSVNRSANHEKSLRSNLRRLTARRGHEPALRQARPANPAPPSLSPPTISSVPKLTCLRRLVKQGGFGKFHHYRELTPIDNQTSSAPTATRCIRPACSISMQGR